MSAERIARSWIFNVIEVDELDVAEIAHCYDVDVDELTDAFDRVRVTVSFKEKK